MQRRILNFAKLRKNTVITKSICIKGLSYVIKETFEILIRNNTGIEKIFP